MSQTPYQREWKRRHMMRQRHGDHWELIYWRDGFSCQQCGRGINTGEVDLLEIDHIKPVSLGGARHDPHNQQLLCKPCNLAKQTLEGSRYLNYKDINERRRQEKHIRAIAGGIA